tara:strand:- start:548 stop:1132 length:585 start_codon:yes stop_codon:yes gene_type:complete
MTKSIQFYYDFSSPYTYIAHKKIREVQKKEAIKFIYCPMLLGGLHKLAGITANAFIKNKNEFMRRDCEMVSKKLKIDFKFNDYFPISSLYLMRGSLVISKDLSDEYIDCFFDAYWKDNINLSDDEIFKDKLKDLHIDENTFLNSISKKKTKEKLIELTQKAYDKKIFGAPTFICNNKIFWGQDRLDYAIEEFSK